MNKLLVVVAFLILSSCSSFDRKHSQSFEEELKLKIGTKLELPISNQLGSNKLHIISYIDGDCYSCLEYADLWNKFAKKISNRSVSIVIYLHSSNYDYLKRNYSIFTNSDVMIIEDKDKLFPKYNNLSENKILQTFLIDHNQKILLIGNPVMSENIETLYFKVINEEIVNYQTILLQKKD